MGLVIFLVVLGLLVAVAVMAYNRLVALGQRSEEAWSDVDVQLKRRTDLVPNLVESVKGYADHERGTFEEVVRARGAAVNAETHEARGRAEGQLSDALRHLFAVAESYPDLKANENFQSLQESLGQIESDIQSARRYYNAVVRDLNTAVDSFPSNQIALVFRFVKRGYFELDRPEDRQVSKVSFPGRA
jgi:LemA protein